MSQIRFSVIIPTFNEAHTLSKCIASVRASNKEVEIIVVDGNSHDQTLDIAQKENVIVCRSANGRGSQLNEGARCARGEILLFLHADTRLPSDAFAVLKRLFENPKVQIGTFSLAFDRNHWLLNFYARMTKFDSLWTRFGDQCIVTRKAFFASLNGFPHWPLFEDVRFLQEARKRTKIHSFSVKVTTSADKFLKNGYLRQQLRNGWLIVQYLMGVSPEILYKKYSD